MEKHTKYWRKPLDKDSARISPGKVVIIEERCKSCGFCIAYCPRQVLQLSANFNKKGYHPPEVIDAAKCVNCHFCEVLCPDFAIYSLQEDTDAKDAGKGD
jgi:2-oxoglutarate ferredoxin oxidoreductase subunit delta